MIQCLLLFILLTEQAGEKNGVSISPGSVNACFCIDLHVTKTALFSVFISLHEEQLSQILNPGICSKKIFPAFSFFIGV